MTIAAQVILDSISPENVRLTTLQLQYPKFIHCFDDKTEVLGEINNIRGFYPWEKVLNQENTCSLAAYDPIDESIQFEIPLSLFSKEVQDEPLIYIENQRISMGVTQDHRLYVGSRKSWGDEWEIIHAKELLNGFTQKRFKTSGILKTGTHLGKLANLLGFFIGDGNIQGNKAIFHMRKSRKIDYLCSLLCDMDIPYEKVDYEDGCTSIKTYGHVELFRSCYNEKKEKQIPQCLFNTDKVSFYEFMKGLFYSDGSTDKEECKIFNTTSFFVANSLNTLASLYGYRINLTGPYAEKKYKLTRSKEENPILRSDKTDVVIYPYSGMIYCGTVSTGLLLVRRDGLVHVSGNSELMTHRVFSRNASSSRAIPVQRIIKAIQEDPAMPIYWGLNQKGMQAREEASGERLEDIKADWLAARDQMIEVAKYLLEEYNLHKQLVNRLLEPWSHIFVVVTATEWENFFNLRRHPDSQPEICVLANRMWEAMGMSTPKRRSYGEWHLPYVLDEDHAYLKGRQYNNDLLVKISSARCARVSYKTHDGFTPKFEEDMVLHDDLRSSGHMSPLEHPAQPNKDNPQDFCGNFRGWKQYRKMIPGEDVFQPI